MSSTRYYINRLSTKMMPEIASGPEIVIRFLMIRFNQPKSTLGIFLQSSVTHREPPVVRRGTIPFYTCFIKLI